MNIGSALVLKTVDMLAGGKTEGIAQKQLISDSSEIKHAPKIFKEDCRINWGNNVTSIYNHIRGLSPYPTAWTEIKHHANGEIQMMKVYASEKSEGNLQGAKIGTVSSDGKTELKVACLDGWIRITELQLSGRKKMNVEEFLRGFQQIKEYSFI